MDAANAVIALSCVAKLQEGHSPDSFSQSLRAHAGWMSLQRCILKCAETLEPRGVAMVINAAARLHWKDATLLRAMSRTSVVNGADLGISDAARVLWALAKL